MSLHSRYPSAPADNRKLRTMSDCEGPGAIGINRAQLRSNREALGRVPPLAAMLATACLFASACAPLSDSAPPRDEAAVDAVGPTPGRIYADAACASCHAVAPGQARSPNPKAPTFETIANAPGMTLMALNVALHTSHKTMPNLIIEPSRIEDLSAYLQTLKR